MTTPMDFTELTELSAARIGGLVLGANDEFFAPKEALLLPTKPEWREGEYTDRGKWMDGWETRRRRTPGHDWCVLKLGLPGVIRGVVVDTAFFRGNFPESCSIEGTVAPVAARFEDLCAESTQWVEILPKSLLKGDSQNRFEVKSPVRFTHLRFHIYPDGGVARLRVHGDVIPNWDLVSPADAELDLAAMENGGLVLATSDEFFGKRNNLIAPGSAANMGDGWESRRRRGPGFDWAILRLGTPGTVKRLEIDTNHFKGNFPDTASVEGCHAPDATVEQLAGTGQTWVELLPRVKLQAHTRHLHVLTTGEHPPVTHLRLNIFPDGGVSRFRVWGAPSDEGRAQVGIARLDGLTDNEALAEIQKCCGSTRWAKAVLAARPFGNAAGFHKAAEAAFAPLEKNDWLEAFAAHPRIGDKSALREKAKGWEVGEQSGANTATDAVLDALIEGNREYEKRFGHIYIVCATGKTAEQMLALLRTRIANTPDHELANAAAEQKEITRLRLRKLLGLAV